MRDDLGVVDESLPNPFIDHKLGNKRKDPNKSRVAFTKDEVKILYDAIQAKKDEDLFHIFLIAIYTGARREEIGQMKITSEDFFTITDAKTQAGNRTIPIHPNLNSLLEEILKKGKDNYLFPNLSEDKFGKKTDAIGKRFGRRTC